MHNFKDSSISTDESDPRVTINLFGRYIKQREDGSFDVSAFISRECYEEWLRTRRTPPKRPPHAFRKALTGHCRGDKGLQPFTEEIGKAVLKMLRKRKIWPCFEGTGINIGERGCKTIGFWEKKQETFKKARTAFSGGSISTYSGSSADQHQIGTGITWFPPSVLSLASSFPRKKVKSRSEKAFDYLSATGGKIPLKDYNALMAYFNGSPTPSPS